MPGNGYKRFTAIRARDERAMRRQQALEAELARHGLNLLATHLTTPPTTLDLGRGAMRAILAGGHAPEVVVCSSDVPALGALTARIEGRPLKGNLIDAGFQLIERGNTRTIA